MIFVESMEVTPFRDSKSEWRGRGGGARQYTPMIVLSTQGKSPKSGSRIPGLSSVAAPKSCILENTEAVSQGADNIFGHTYLHRNRRCSNRLQNRSVSTPRFERPRRSLDTMAPSYSLKRVMSAVNMWNARVQPYFRSWS